VVCCFFSSLLCVSRVTVESVHRSGSFYYKHFSHLRKLQQPLDSYPFYTHVSDLELCTNRVMYVQHYALSFPSVGSFQLFCNRRNFADALS
jgi:hypothetical protein